MTPLTAHEKAAIVARVFELQLVLAMRSTAYRGQYKQFRAVYRGDSRAFVDAFNTCRTDEDRERWLNQLAIYSRDEIEPGVSGERDITPTLADIGPSSSWRGGEYRATE